LWELDLPYYLVHGTTNIIYYLTFLVIKYTFLGVLIGGHNGWQYARNRCEAKLPAGILPWPKRYVYKVGGLKGYVK
jgi:hypothetical protein